MGVVASHYVGASAALLTSAARGMAVPELRSEAPLLRDINEITGMVVDAAFHIHSRLGPGLFESVYEHLLQRNLVRRGLRVERQIPIGFEFDGEFFENGFRADLLVENCVLVEVKSVVELPAVFFMQIRTYLRLLGYPVGLLINFNTPVIKDGIKRITNGQPPPRRTFHRDYEIPQR